MLNNSQEFNAYIGRVQQSFVSNGLIDQQTGQGFRPSHLKGQREIRELAQALMKLESHAHQSSQNAK